MTQELKPKDHGEAIALFRSQVLGPVLCADLVRRELARALRDLAAKRFLLPGSKVTRSFAASTLQRWYYRHRKHGLAGLRPGTRKTGHALEVAPRIDTSGYEVLREVWDEDEDGGPRYLACTLFFRELRWCAGSQERCSVG